MKNATGCVCLCAARITQQLVSVFKSRNAFYAPHLSSGVLVCRARDKPETFVETWCAL